MSTQSVAGGVRLIETQLVSQRLANGPRALIVTLAPTTKGTANGTPWYAPWNGTSDNPVPTDADPLPFGAPALPDPGKGLRVRLRFGAGGAAVVTMFDYPANGACFGVTADLLDIDVVPIDEDDPKVYPSVETIPFVGAWFVEGNAADPSPLQWAEVPQLLGEAAVLYYSVKPFARQLEITSSGGNVDEGGLQVDWHDTDGALVKRENIPNVPQFVGQAVGGGNCYARLEVPSQATYCNIGNGNTATVTMLATWKIGLV